jgi:hypothetical protein
MLIFITSYIPAGPFGLTFAILYQQFVLLLCSIFMFSHLITGHSYRIVPSTYHFRILGITFSNKVLTYILALQVIIKLHWI